MIIFSVLILAKGHVASYLSNATYLVRLKALGPMLKITSTRGARSKNTLKIIIIGHSDSLPFLLVMRIQDPLGRKVGAIPRITG